MTTLQKHAIVAVLSAGAVFGAMKLVAPVAPAPTTPILELPTTLKTVTGKQVKIVATTKESSVQWMAPEGCDLTPSESGLFAIFSAHAPGRYNVAAWTVKDGKPTPPAICEIEVSSKPEPVPPEPKPEPKPDPKPEPAPSALVLKLQNAYALDKQPSAVKAEQKIMLIGIYQAVALKAQDKSVKSTADLMKQLRTAVEGLMKADSLIEVRTLVANEAKLQFGEAPAQLTDDLRARLVTFWQGMADSLKQVK